MMVFSRQAVREKLEKDVRDNILQTQLLLSRLKGALTDVEKNSFVAKQDVQKATDLIIQQLVKRKMEMTRKIDVLTQPQIHSLQERIHSTCVTLGNLQSTLNNLDSFDYNLVRLAEPNISWPETAAPSELQIEVPTDVVAELIEKWGSVKLKGELSENHDQQQEPKLSTEDCQLYGKEISCVPSTLTLKSAPVTNSSINQSINTSTDCEQRLGSVKENQPDLKDFQIEKWLRGMKIQKQSSTDSDDFEMLSELEPMKPLLQCNKNSQCIEPGHNKNTCDGEDGSSIICVESDDLSFGVDGGSEDDIGKWLKPKKQKRACVSNPSSSISSEIMQTYLYKSKTPLTDRHLDFPCLRLPSNTWVPKRKTSSLLLSSSSSSDKSQTKKSNILHSKANLELCLQMGQNEIIPPNFALPYPFWLKKY